MADDPQDKPARKPRRINKAASTVLPVGLGRQASAPRVEAWGLVVGLRRPVQAPVLLSRAQSTALAKALVQSLYPDAAQRAALARAGHVLALADGLMSADTFMTDVDVQSELHEIAAYLGRVLPPPPSEGEERTPWLTLTDCFHVSDKSDDMAAFATGLYDEAHALVLCLPLFRAHFEHQGPDSDPFNGPFADAAHPPRSQRLDAALARALGVAEADIRTVSLATLRTVGVLEAEEADAQAPELEFGRPGWEGELFALAQRDKHELDACASGEELARALQVMRAQAADEQATQFGWRRHVSVAVRADGKVLLGFATVDEMGQAVREALDGREVSGERLALRWQRWLMDHYIPLLQEVFDVRDRALSFSAPAAASARRGGAAPGGVQDAPPALEAVFVERSPLVQGDEASGVRAQAWRCLALAGDAPDKPSASQALRGNAFLLCVVLVVLDRDDQPVQQWNFFHTTPFAADTLKDSAEHHAKQRQLPLQWRWSLLHVGDEALRLSVLEAQELHVNAPDTPRPAWHRRDH